MMSPFLLPNGGGLGSSLDHHLQLPNSGNRGAHAMAKAVAFRASLTGASPFVPTIHHNDRPGNILKLGLFSAYRRRGQNCLLASFDLIHHHPSQSPCSGVWDRAVACASSLGKLLSRYSTNFPIPRSAQCHGASETRCSPIPSQPETPRPPTHGHIHTHSHTQLTRAAQPHDHRMNCSYTQRSLRQPRQNAGRLPTDAGVAGGKSLSLAANRACRAKKKRACCCNIPQPSSRAYHGVQSNAAQPDPLRILSGSTGHRMRCVFHASRAPTHLLVVPQLFLFPTRCSMCLGSARLAYLNKLVPALLPLSITLSALIVAPRPPHFILTAFPATTPTRRSLSFAFAIPLPTKPGRNRVSHVGTAPAPIPRDCAAAAETPVFTASSTPIHRYLHTSNSTMAYADARFGYQQPQTDSALDNKQTAFIDTDSSSLLNQSVLDGDMMQSPHDTFRKNSFANSNGVLSPADSQTWDHPFASGLNPDPSSAGVPGSFQEDSNAFLRQSNPHVATYPNQQQHSSWAFENGSGDHTPTTGAEFMPPPQYDGPHFIPQRQEGATGSFAQQHPMPQHFISASQVQTPMSPHSHQDWMGMAEREMENRPSHKRMRPNSPPRSMSDAQRRDGIRKKNGRIDIPQERNIQNIEDLIEQATDDDMVKELKQQKRLLRNREAA